MAEPRVGRLRMVSISCSEYQCKDAIFPPGYCFLCVSSFMHGHIRVFCRFKTLDRRLYLTPMAAILWDLPIT